MSSVDMFTYNISKLSKVVVQRELEDYYSVNQNEDNYNTINVAQPLNNKGSDDITHDVMPSESANHHEAYYLYFIAVVGIILNCVVIMAIFVRKPMRNMTSGFLVHACFLDLLKSAYCIPIGNNLLTQNVPSSCTLFGASFVIIVTTSVFNMVAMVITEAYTFGEANIGGNAKGTIICVIFGIVLVYVGSIILHLGPTLIGGHFEFQPEIGSCSFILGKQTGYIANVMWIVITTVAIMAVIHFIRKLYTEIQINQPNRVSFLVRTSITVIDSATRSACNLRKIIKDAIHRAKMFILNTTVFVICWYPLFFLIVIDKNFRVAPQVYQTFAFIAWSHGAIQPILYILFDRNINLLAKHFNCDQKRPYDIDTIAQLMMNRRQNTDQSEPRVSTTDMDQSMAYPSAPAHDFADNRDAIRIEGIHEQQQQMYAVQNYSNQSADNCDLNTSVGGSSTEHFHLTNQLPRNSNSKATVNETGESSKIPANHNVHLDSTLPIRGVRYYTRENYTEADGENEDELYC